MNEARESVIKCRQTCSRRELYSVSLILLTCTYFQSLKSQLHPRVEESIRNGEAAKWPLLKDNLNFITTALIPLCSSVFTRPIEPPSPNIRQINSPESCLQCQNSNLVAH